MKKLFASKDISCFTLYSLISSLIFETPIFILYLSSRGVKYSEIAFLFSIYAIAVIGFEYITGVFADRYSRKGILIFSMLCLIIGETCFLFGVSNYFVLAVGMIIMALSTASRSGADVAFLYDKLKERNEVGDFDHLISIIGSAALVSSAAACIIGSALTRLAMYIPIVGTIITSTASLIVLLFFKEPAVKEKESEAVNIIKGTLHTAFRNNVTTKYILISLIIFPCYHILDQLLQPFMKLNGIGTEYFGIFYTVFTISQALGTRISGSLSRMNAEKVLSVSSILIILGFALMAINNYLIVYIVPVFMGISFGIYYTVNSIVLNKAIESNIRASVLSFQHSLTKVMQTVMFGCIGLVIDNHSLRIIFLFFALISGIGFVATAFINKFLVVPQKGKPEGILVDSNKDN